MHSFTPQNRVKCELKIFLDQLFINECENVAVALALFQDAPEV